MAIISVVILIFLFPFLWVIWTGVDVKNGKKERMEWKKPSILLFILLLISTLISFYFYRNYQLPLFSNSFETIIGLVLAGVFLVIFSIINIIASIVYKGAPKSFHNPKGMWIFTGVFCFTILFFITWVYPFGEKSSYVYRMEVAVQALSESETDEEITVLLMNSEKQCVRRKTERCIDEDYQNYFLVKNNLDEEKEVQVRIRALNTDKEEIKVVDSNIMTLGAGELRLVETEETNDNTSIWSRSTFTTEIRTSYYEYLFRFRDPSEE